MTDTQDLIARLRTDPAMDDTTLGNEAADALEAAQAEIELANARLHEVATLCATVEQQRDAALARLAELEKQEPVAIAVADVTNTGYLQVRVHADAIKFGDKLFAAAGASPVQPSQAGESPRFPTVLRKMWSGGEVQDWINANWNAAINAKGVK